MSDMDLSLIDITASLIKQMEGLIEQLTDDLDKKKKELAAEELKNERSEELVDSLLDFKNLYEHGTVEQQKIILNQLIDKIVVRDTDDLDIYLNITDGSTSLLPRQI